MARRTWKRRNLVQLGICPTPDQMWKRICQTNLPSILCRDEAFAAALAIRDGDALVRFELESRILAVQPQAEIAVSMAIPKDVVAEYEFWFFDVRKRLDMTGWILHEAIRRRPTGVLEPGDIGPLWRWIGYHFGSVVLDLMLAAVDAETLKRKGIDAYLKKDARLDPVLKMLILIDRMPAPETPEQWNRLLRCKRVFSMAAVPQTEELLSPIRMEFLPFSEPEVSIPAEELQENETVEQLYQFITEHLVKQVPVVQAQAA